MTGALGDRAGTRGGVALDPEHGLELQRRMLLVRRFEEACAEMYAAGRIRGFLHLYIGEEAVAVGAMQALSDEDAVVATYREHAHALARGIPPAALMAEIKEGRLVPVETVLLTQRGGFRNAVEEGVRNLKDAKAFDSMVDVRLARDGGVTPLPLGTGWGNRKP